ncbi:hypothetical protein H8E07_22055 [bacterium]|nr:hypothetical protein [bacterium]
MFDKHYHERMSPDLRKLFARRGVRDLKVALWNAFFDSELTGICDDDCSAVPRILPASYLPTIVGAARDTTEFLLKYLAFPDHRLLALHHSTPVTRYLLNQIGVLDHRPRRLTGSIRYDFAIEGPPRPDNPPKLFEINEIGFDGSGRSSYIQKAILTLFPELRKRVRVLDTARSELRNMSRLGRRLLRLQYDVYNWEDEVNIAEARRQGLEMELVSPEVFGIEMDPDFPLLRRAPISVRRNRLVVGGSSAPPDAVQISYSFELPDYEEGRDLFRSIVRSRTHHYSPFLTGLVAPKSTLLLLDDHDLQEELLGPRRARRLRRSLLPVRLLSDCFDEVKRKYRRLVIKQVDGLGGELVFVGKEILPQLDKIPARQRRDWIVQKRVLPNVIEVDGILSRRRRVMADLGVFVHYDWDGERFRSFRVGGMITRATNRSKKVNVSGGGIQVPVMFDRAR